MYIAKLHALTFYFFVTCFSSYYPRPSVRFPLFIIYLHRFETLINLDGGGSSVSIYDGDVISRPTCDDTGKVCERSDANIVCVKKSASVRRGGNDASPIHVENR